MTRVIGSQTDVPDVGDPIVSPWYQDTATKIVHRFATTAARDAWVSPPNGAMCVTLDTNTVWHRIGGAWRVGTYSPINSIRANINDAGLILILGETAVVVTDAAGNADVPFPVAFAAPPQVIPINGDPSSGAGFMVQLWDSAVTASKFSIKLIGFPNGGGVTNTAVRVNYLAIGRRT